MKNLKLPIFFLMVLLLGSCLKSENTKRYTFYEPIYASSQEVRDNVKNTAPQTIENMAGMIVYQDHILTIEKGRGIHIIDATHPNHLQQLSFIPIPGCTGLAIRNDYLYANSYMDLFILDVKNIEEVSLVGYTNDVFKNMRYIAGYPMDGDDRIIDWVKKDTVVSEEYLLSMPNVSVVWFDDNFAPTTFNGAPTEGGNSTGGSMARFTLVDHYMYAVDQNAIHSFDLSNPIEPGLTNTQNIGWNIETIYPFKDKLFVGSQSGMYIFSIHNPAMPIQESEFSHVRSCDPVIADDKYAYVTLRSGTACQGFTNQMEVLNVEDINSPQLIKTYPFTNPHGLGMYEQVMFLCDGDAGIRILDIADPYAIQETQKFEIGTAIDVIMQKNKAYVLTTDQILIFQFTTAKDVQLQGSINI